MQTLTLEQLRATTDAGGVTGVTVKAQGNRFFVQIATRTGEAILTKARSGDPRRFGNPFHAMSVLRQVGIVSGTYDLSRYEPRQQDMAMTRPDQAAAMRQTHADAAYARWLRESVQASIDDPRPSIDHETVKTDFAERRAALASHGKDNG